LLDTGVPSAKSARGYFQPFLQVEFYAIVLVGHGRNLDPADG